MNYTSDQKDAWDRSLQLVQDSLDMMNYNAWFKPLKLYAIVGDRIIVITQSAYHLSHLRNRYGAMLEHAVRVIFGQKYGREYRLEYHTTYEVEKISLRPAESSLNAQYTFDNFVVGGSNTFAYHAAVAVAEEPNDSYNPLFIYGGVGLGKTHLMNAVGNYVLSVNPDARVLLLTSETMHNQLVDGITRKNTSALKERMRNLDYLMVDDVQFLAKTKITQEEFFHTFNALYENHKQIIISSDRSPNELPEIEERLRSRFQNGLIVDIQKPDYETRCAILRQKADSDGIEIPNDVVDYVARNVSSNIRELEGALTRLNAQSRLMCMPITLDLAVNALNHLIKAQEAHKITVELIISTVADRFGVSADDITGKRKSRDIAMPRQIAMYICREMTDLSTTSIGRAFGNRDHTTVMHGCEKIAEAMSGDVGFKKRVDDLIRMIGEQ